ncbi:hypothetical protein AAHA92_29120 [Salvia divinorum]|uniref:Uncharacterized protein n=1 Tax=Salvia divinorum TaxID=28513 RepID=A0ABD1FXB2_SALDI
MNQHLTLASSLAASPFSQPPHPRLHSRTANASLFLLFSSSHLSLSSLSFSRHSLSCRCAGDEGMEEAMLQGVERQQDSGDHSPAGEDRTFVEIKKWASSKWRLEMSVASGLRSSSTESSRSRSRRYSRHSRTSVIRSSRLVPSPFGSPDLVRLKV